MPPKIHSDLMLKSDFDPFFVYSFLDFSYLLLRKTSPKCTGQMKMIQSFNQGQIVFFLFNNGGGKLHN
jgi:hypothetical protein